MIHDVIDLRPPIDTPRFRLRPVCGADAPVLARHAGDLRVARATRSIPHPLPPGAVDAFITRAMAPDRSEEVWVMEGTHRDASTVFGVISLIHLERAQAQLCYWVAPRFRDKGIASEAVQALVAANPLANRTLFAEVFQDNPASARVLTHAGFQYIGDAESQSVARAAMVPTWTYLRQMG